MCECQGNPLARVTLALGLPYLLVNRALKVTIQIRKSMSKGENSELKVDFESENFKFKLTIKYKIHFHNWQFKSHN